MNSEFPSRIPTVINNQNNSTNSGSATDSSTKSFRSQIISIYNSVVDYLHKISDSLMNFMNGKFFTQSQPRNPQRDKDQKRETRERVSFFKYVRRGFTSLNNAWKSGISSLQMTFEQVASSIGSAIGGVFGTGVFSRVLSSVITKTLSFAVSKVLLGMVVSNLPMVLLVGAIIAAIGTVIYFAEDIWDAIKYVGHAIDQGIDAIISLLPGQDSKYAEAREGLAKQTRLRKQDIAYYYGDTVEGRNKMLEDFRKAQNDPAYAEQLSEQIRTKVIGDRKDGTYQKVQQEILDEELEGSALTKPFRWAKSIYKRWRNQDPDEEWDYGELGSSNPEMNMTPIITTNNNSALEIPNFFGSNVSMMYPMSSINNEFNLNYSPIGQY